MADPRFFERRGPFGLEELADTVGSRLGPGPDRQVDDVTPPEAALEPGIDTHAVVDARARTRAGSRIDAGAVIDPRVQIGAGCRIGSPTVIGPGGTPGHAPIGANVPIDRRPAGDTLIGAGPIIDKLAQMAHDGPTAGAVSSSARWASPAVRRSSIMSSWEGRRA